MRPGFQRRKITHAVNAVCKKLVSILTFAKKYSVPSSQYSVGKSPHHSVVKTFLSVILSRWSKKAKNPVTIKKDGILQSLSLHQDDTQKRMTFKEKLSKLFSFSSYTGKRKIDKEIDQKIDALKQKTAEINQLDREIIRLQQSGKTTFRSMNRLHVYLTMRSKSYHKLHTLRYATHFNFSALIIFVISLSFAISSNYTSWMGPLLPKRLAAVEFIHASAPEDTSIYTGESNSLKIGYSNKEAKTVGINAISKSDRIPNADQYQLSMNLLSDGLNLPEENKLSSVYPDKQISSMWTPVPQSTNFSLDKHAKAWTTDSRSSDFSLLSQAEACSTYTGVQALACLLQTKVWSTSEAHAQDSTEPQSSQSLPSSTVIAKEVTAPGPEDVIYDISDKITVRYHMEERKVKEYIIVKDKGVFSKSASQQASETASSSVIARSEAGDEAISEIAAPSSTSARNDNTADQLGNTLSFSLNSTGLSFIKDPVDNSYLAVTEENKDKKYNETPWVFRILAPTVEDKNHKQGKISMEIRDQASACEEQTKVCALENGDHASACEDQAKACALKNQSANFSLDQKVAIYTIDPEFLKTAEYPITIDPPVTSGGTTCTWDDGSGNHNWDASSDNWSCAGGNHAGANIPAAGDAVVFNGTANTNVTAYTNTVADEIYSITLDTGYTSALTFQANPIYNTDVNKRHIWRVHDITVNSGQMVFTGDTSVNPTDDSGNVLNDIPGCTGATKCGRGIILIAEGDVTVASGASINANGKGFAKGTGPGTVSSGITGASHGGRGGNAGTGATYDSLINPLALGSGGYSEAQTEVGGGAIALSCANSVSINGTLSANGGNGITNVSYGNGAGGSIRLSAGTLSGAGTISANGGDHAGGGGRVSLSGVTTDNFAGTLQANGGLNSSNTDTLSSRGYAGTIYLSSTRRANLSLGGASDIRSPLRLGTDDAQSAYTFGTITIQNGGILEIDSNITLNSANGGVASINADTLDVQLDGKLRADGLGFVKQHGPGASANMADGASYGGRGGDYNGDSASSIGHTYGSAVNPTYLGSGGFDNFGGGAVVVAITGTITVNGTLSANGAQGVGGVSYGSGSGGSINITAGILAGTGTISANGSNFSGGGGRVSLNGVTTDNFAGTLQANGGVNNPSSWSDLISRGYAGSIYLDSARRANLSLGGVGDIRSPLRLGTDDEQSAYTFGAITIQNGGILEVDSNLYLNSGKGGSAPLNITTLDVQSDGFLRADGLGFPRQQGPGKSTSNQDSASYGGMGGDHGGDSASTMGSTYGSIINPTALGSGGYDNTGGGSINIVASASITVNGTISAGGTSGLGGTWGTGSGGSINITSGTVVGAGTVRANGSSYSGGGGRIGAVLTSGNSFGSISFQALGGTVDTPKGGAGTIYKQTSDGTKTVTIDNNGVTPNAGTVIPDTGTGVQDYSGTGTWTVTNGGMLTHLANTSSKQYAINATVDALNITSNGSVNADGKGYAANQGLADGSYGGVHGCNGCISVGTYGSITDPIDLGSGQSSGGSGGGAIRISTGTIAIEGAVSANGSGTGANGGGAGGSVFITSTSDISGNGIIATDGGNGWFGGGGGRVSLVGNSVLIPLSKISNHGGTGSSYTGGAGTTYINNNNAKSVTIDNNGVVGVDGTIIPDRGSSNYDYSDTGDWTVTNGGYLTHRANSTTALGEQYKMDLRFSNLTIASTGKVDVTAKGYSAQNGPGAGSGTSGGGYGGSGGQGDSGASGSTYGSKVSPTNIGSGGGGTYFSGGGAIKITVMGTLQLVSGGSINANGYSATWANEGGGSGGSIFIIVNILTGTGTINAKGGAGHGAGTGGGGGGRITVAVTGTNSGYSGVISAVGGVSGGGALAGEDGTVNIQHAPVVDSTFTPIDGINGVPAYISQNPIISFTAHDSDASNFPGGDYFRMKLEVADDSGFSQNLLTFTQLLGAGGSTVTNGGYTGSYAGMNYKSDSVNFDSYQSTGSVAGTFTFLTPLVQGHTYYLRLSACDDIGFCGALTQWSTATSTHGMTISPIDKVVITSTPTTTIVHNITPIYSIQIRNSLNEAVVVASQQINLSSTPAVNGTTRYFCSDSSSCSTTQITALTFTSASSGSFYFYDQTPGTDTISVVASGQSWTGDSQSLIMINDVPHHLDFTVSGSPTSIKTSDPQTVTLTAYDQYNNPAITSPNNFTGSKSVTFTADKGVISPSGCSSNADTNSTIGGTNIGTPVSLTFDSNTAAVSSTMVIKKVVDNLTITASSSGIAADTYSLSVTPGNLDHYDVSATSYPKSGNKQVFALAENLWSATTNSLNSPFHPDVTAKDIYCNTKTDYVGSLWFTTEEGIDSDFAYTDATPYTFTPGDLGHHVFTAESDNFLINSIGESIPVSLHGENGGSPITPTAINVRVKGLGIDRLSTTFDSSMAGQDLGTFNSSVTVSSYGATGSLQTD